MSRLTRRAAGLAIVMTTCGCGNAGPFDGNVDFHLQVQVLGDFVDSAGQTYGGTIAFAGSG